LRFEHIAGDNPYILPGSILEVGTVLGSLDALALMVRPFVGNIEEAKSLHWLDGLTAEEA